jgi:hypothetical protein
LVEEFRLIDKQAHLENPSPPREASCWDIEKMKNEGVVSANTKEFYLLEFLLAKERFNLPVQNKNSRAKETIAYVNGHKENIAPSAGRNLKPMDERGLSTCKSNLRDALEQQKLAGVEIAKRESRALLRS